MPFRPVSEAEKVGVPHAELRPEAVLAASTQVSVRLRGFRRPTQGDPHGQGARVSGQHADDRRIAADCMAG